MSINLSFILIAVSIFGLVSFITQRHHILICLLRLEATVLSIAFAIALLSSSLSFSFLFYRVIILTFGACEAAVALAVLVIITRTFGADLVSSVNLNKC